jgi:hypothetical protein
VNGECGHSKTPPPTFKAKAKRRKEKKRSKRKPPKVPP